MMAASWCFWRWTRRSTWAWALATAAMLGAALSTRLTAAVLLPCFAALAVFESARAEERRVVLRRSLGLAAAVLVVVPTVIWAAHGFRNPAGRVGGNGTAAAARPGEGRSSGLRPSAVLPSAYVEGIRFQADHNRRGHMAYLLGERSRTGWRHYFAVAFLVKSTPGWLLLVALAAGVSAVGRGAGDVPRWHWLLPALATFAAVSAGHIQIGERYLLPVHASLVPWAASVLALWTRGGTRPRVRVAVVAAGLAAHAGPSLLAAGPGHLAYFNLLAGGTASGHRVLLDSNLDWGQDLPRLATWMRRRGVPSVQLAYMGSDDPARYGIRREDLPGRHLYPARPAPGLAGTVAVSPNLLFDLLPGLAGQYAALRDRPPDERAGVFFIYHLGAPAAGPP
jgi:hypothetical protein